MSDAPTMKRRWFHPQPGWLVAASLAASGVLVLSERYRWFEFNRHKGYTVLAAVAGLAAVLAALVAWWLAALVFRRRFQFSIRSLLALTLAAALPCSWLAVEAKQAREQRKAVEAVERLGGTVWHDWDINCSNYLRISQLYLQPRAAPWLRSIVGDDFLADVCGVDLISAQFTDAGLGNLRGLTALQWLFLGESRLTDAGLENLRALGELQQLYIGSAQITDAGLASLRGLTALQLLDLAGTQVTDAGVRQLQQVLPNCEITH